MKPYRLPSEPNPVREKFALVRKELSSALIERDEEVNLVLTALLANEHVLLVGPPGCAKSLLLDAVMDWMTSGSVGVEIVRGPGAGDALMGYLKNGGQTASRYVSAAR